MGKQFSGQGRNYLSRLLKTIEALDTDSIDNAIELVAETWQNGKQIICNKQYNITSISFQYANPATQDLLIS